MTEPASDCGRPPDHNSGDDARGRSPRETKRRRRRQARAWLAGARREGREPERLRPGTRERMVQPGVAWSGFPRGTCNRATCPRTTSRRHSWGIPVRHPNTSGLAVPKRKLGPSSGGLDAHREATVGLDTKRPWLYFAASWRLPQDLLTTSAFPPAHATAPGGGRQTTRGPSCRSNPGRALGGCLPDGTGIARLRLEWVKTPCGGVAFLGWRFLVEAEVLSMR